MARFGPPATASIDHAEDLSPQLSPFRDALIGKKPFYLNELAARRWFPSPAPLPPKTERIDVRASTPVKQLLQIAARACHKNVSEFLTDAGVTAATQALADRRQFVLDERQWQAFQ